MKGMESGKHSTLLRTFVNYDHKTFYYVDSRPKVILIALLVNKGQHGVFKTMQRTLEFILKTFVIEIFCSIEAIISSVNFLWLE
jgi:hypothetical protein